MPEDAEEGAARSRCDRVTNNALQYYVEIIERPFKATVELFICKWDPKNQKKKKNQDHPKARGSLLHLAGRLLGEKLEREGGRQSKSERK